MKYIPKFQQPIASGLVNRYLKANQYSLAPKASTFNASIIPTIPPTPGQLVVSNLLTPKMETSWQVPGTIGYPLPLAEAPEIKISEDYKDRYKTFGEAFKAASHEKGKAQFIWDGKPIAIKFADAESKINKEQAKEAIERLKDEIDGKIFPCDNSSISISFSINAGIAEYKDSLKDENELFKLADATRYENKKIDKDDLKSAGLKGYQCG